MKIGFLTNWLVRMGMDDFEQLADWAVANGFSDLEVGPTVPLDYDLYSKVMSKSGITVTALTYCRNFLSTDEQEAAAHLEELKRRIRFAGVLGIANIVTSTGIDKSIEEGVYDNANSIRKLPIRSLDKFCSVFTPVLELAEQCNVTVTLENCPLMGNIAISPVLWRAIFDRLDSEKLGITYDPSHLVWQFIDPYAPIAEFADRIHHVHAKDTQIDRERLAQCGILTDFSWWSYRIPGHGELDWGRLIGELKRVGYSGTVSIEHEDPDFKNSLEQVQQGLIMGRAKLVEFIRE